MRVSDVKGEAEEYLKHFCPTCPCACIESVCINAEKFKALVIFFFGQAG